MGIGISNMGWDKIHTGTTHLFCARCESGVAC